MPGLTTDTVTAKVLYSPPEDGSKPQMYLSPPEGIPPKNYGFEEHIVQFENVRGKEGAYSLDTAGFYFGKYSSNHQSFNNDEEIQKEYYPESTELIKRLTGASKVVPFNHTVRCRTEGDTGLDPRKRGPVPHIHVDQSSSASYNRVLQHLPEDEANELLKRRFQIINLWRPISHPAEDWPLAVCDFRSIDREKDLVPVDFILPDKVGETLAVRYNPQHKWKYLRGITPEEFILIKV